MDRVQTLKSNHRCLFNGDTCTFFYNPELWQPEGGPFSAKAIHAFVRNLAVHGIDTFIINPNTQRVWYPSRTMPTILEGYERGDKEFFRSHLPNAGISADDGERAEQVLASMAEFYDQYVDLRDAGVDWLEETKRACLQHGVAPWVSIRMNDMHGCLSIEDSFMNIPLYGRAEMRLHSSAYAPGIPHESSTFGLNYERREVRDYMFGIIREAVETYGFEGLELDWVRNPLACEPSASSETKQIMTEWMRSVRELTDRQASAGGGLCPLGLRLSGNWRVMEAIGVDVREWIREGLIDFIAISNYLQASWDVPHDELRREFGDRIAIYGVVENIANWLPARSPETGREAIRRVSASEQLMRGNAAGKWALGADGIEWFNFFTSDQAREPGVRSRYESLPETASLDSLRGLDKQYALSTVIDAPRFYPTSLYPFDMPEQLPVLLKQDWRRAFRLPMCAEPDDGTAREFIIQVAFRRTEERPAIGVGFNGSWPSFENKPTDELLFPVGSFTHHAEMVTAYNFKFATPLIREGWNEIVLFNGNRGTAESGWIEVVSLEAAVRNKLGQ